MLNDFGNFISKDAENILNTYLYENGSGFELFRNWYMKIHQEDFTKNFNIENEVSQSLQKDFLDNKSNMSAEDFDRNLNLTKLYCISYGRNSMTIENYLHIKNLEDSRKERLNEL